MHPLGRPLLMLKQYLDMRLSGAPAWQRVAAGLGLAIACLALIAIGVLSGHYVMTAVGAVLAVGFTRQGVAAARRRWRRGQAGSELAGPVTEPGEQRSQADDDAVDPRSLPRGVVP
jgi:hypothetical protein